MFSKLWMNIEWHVFMAMCIDSTVLFQRTAVICCIVEVDCRADQGGGAVLSPSEIRPWQTDSQFGIVTFLFARQHTDARHWYRNYVRLSVRLSVRCVPWKRPNILSQFHHHTVAHHFSFMSIKHVGEIPTELPTAGVLNTGVVIFLLFLTNKYNYILRTIQLR